MKCHLGEESYQVLDPKSNDETSEWREKVKVAEKYACYSNN